MLTLRSFNCLNFLCITIEPETIPTSGILIDNPVPKIDIKTNIISVTCSLLIIVDSGNYLGIKYDKFVKITPHSPNEASPI